MKVTIRHLYISPGHNYFGRHGKGALDYPIKEVKSIHCEAGKGIRGDRFFDFQPDYKGQLTLFDWDVFESVREKVGDGELQPSAFRRNIIIHGIDLNQLIGRSFLLGDVGLSGSCECSPCYWMDQAYAPGTHEFLKGRGGLRTRIVRSGNLRPGESELIVQDEQSL